MAKWQVTVWASYETEIEADTQDEAEEKAVDDCPFPYADYCETDKIEDEEYQ